MAIASGILFNRQLSNPKTRKAALRSSCAFAYLFGFIAAPVWWLISSEPIVKAHAKQSFLLSLVSFYLPALLLYPNEKHLNIIVLGIEVTFMAAVYRNPKFLLPFLRKGVNFA